MYVLRLDIVVQKKWKIQMTEGDQSRPSLGHHMRSLVSSPHCGLHTVGSPTRAHSTQGLTPNPTPTQLTAVYLEQVSQQRVSLDELVLFRGVVISAPLLSFLSQRFELFFIVSLFCHPGVAAFHITNLQGGTRWDDASNTVELRSAQHALR